MHPPPQPLKKSANLFDRVDYLVHAALWLCEEALNTRHAMEAHAMTTNDFQASLDRNTAATGAAGSAISAEIAQLKAAIDALSTTTAPTQAQLDQLNASSDALEAATASLVADDDAPSPAA